MTALRQSLMSVKTELVKEFLVDRIQSTVAERHAQPVRAEIEAALARADGVSGDQAGGVDHAMACKVARAGYLARVVETELFEPARQPSTALEEPLKRPRDEGDDELDAIASASARLANSEPAERPKPDDPQAMTWRIPGPGGHVRHYLALDAIEWLAGETAVGVGDGEARAGLKRCWLYGFFLRACEEIAPPDS